MKNLNLRLHDQGQPCPPFKKFNPTPRPAESESEDPTPTEIALTLRDRNIEIKMRPGPRHELLHSHSLHEY
jgi:hypothetical protein